MLQREARNPEMPETNPNSGSVPEIISSQPRGESDLTSSRCKKLLPSARGSGKVRLAAPNLELRPETDMPAAKPAPKTSLFSALQSQAIQNNETNDCAVKAIAIVTNTDYQTVLNMVNSRGRKQGKGTPWHVIWETLAALGYEAKQVNVRREFIDNYPKGHQILKSVTTHHPDRFNKVWANGKTYLMCTKAHILAVVNGVNHDWTRGSARPAWATYEIVPK